MMTRTRISVLAGAAVLAAAGLGAGVAIATGGASGQPTAATASPTPAASASPGYSWYRSIMSGHYGSGGGMMGGSSYGWMMNPAGYQWMTGGIGAPGWRSGATLPGSMMGASTDPGAIMGRLFAGAPGPRIGAARAAAAGSQVPAGAQVSRAGNTITFTASRGVGYRMGPGE